MSSKTLTLRFVGPLQVTEYGDTYLLSHPMAKLPGIYFSAVQHVDEEWLVTYIGETSRSMGTRIKEHIIQLAGGNYRICDPMELRKGRAVVLWNGLWRKGTRDKLPDFIGRIQDFSQVVKQLLDIESWFCAPIDCEKRIRRRIEGSMAEHVRFASHSESSLLSSDIRYARRCDVENSIKIRIYLPVRVRGINDLLEA
jgi:hypothetical protein